MGAWGSAPLENDAALDWLQSLFDDHGIRGHVEATLRLDIHEYADEIRAAAHLVRRLVETGLWPDDSRAKIVTMATDRLERLLFERVFSNANCVGAIRLEISSLRATSLSRPATPSSFEL